MSIIYSYASMIAKIIVLGATRNEAIAKLKRALEELQKVHILLS